jgi:hypothetical protein
VTLDRNFHIAVALIIKEKYRLGTSQEVVSKAPLRPNPPKADKFLCLNPSVRLLSRLVSAGTLNLIKGFETISK